MSDLLLQHDFLATPYRFLLHTPTNTAILADLHLGIEHTLRQQGIAFPPINAAEIQRSWNHLRHRLSQNECPGHIIIAGDLFDSPAPDPNSVALAHTLINELPPNIAVTLLPGNHDPSLEALQPLLQGTRATLFPRTQVADYTVIHGHRWADAGDLSTRKGIIVGHQHPAVTLADRTQSAKMICYAVASLDLAGHELRLLVLPTFSRAPLGTNLMTEGRWIIDCPHPWPSMTGIAGIIDHPKTPRVLNFGTLARLMGN
jgi:putative SbcD/Mre11-related phosphoesterase